MSPLPLSSVNTFSSYSGLFWLCIECPKCKRRAEISADSFAARYGRDFLVTDAVKRLVCATCGTKNPTVLIGMKR
jgi:hypothetical protein